MSELYLVRHAQASFGSSNYDQLSDLGYQQSRWLGEYFRGRELNFDAVITGSLQRQQQTAATLLKTMGLQLPLACDPAFDEFDFQNLTRLFCSLTDYPMPCTSEGPRPFFIMMRKAMLAWSRDELHQQPRHQGPALGMESWQQFHDRLAAGLRRLQARPRSQRVLVISSGGAIAMALSQILQCSVETLINLNLQAKNTGISHLFFNAEGMVVSSFNNTPHLESPARQHALTYS